MMTCNLNDRVSGFNANLSFGGHRPGHGTVEFDNVRIVGSKPVTRGRQVLRKRQVGHGT